MLPSLFDLPGPERRVPEREPEAEKGLEPKPEIEPRKAPDKSLADRPLGDNP